MPVVIHGAYAAMSYGEKKINRGQKISIRFLPPVYPGTMSPEELNKQVKDEILKAKKGFFRD